MTTRNTRRGLLGLSSLLVSSVLAGCMSIMPAVAPKAKNIEPNISDAFPYESRFVEVNGSRMHYVESGTGPVVVLVHGNPTSSYLWRNVIPQLDDDHRVIALDLIGMGKSDKPNLDYRLDDHIEYFDGFMSELGLRDATLVLHDWGGGIGLTYARNHSDNVKAVALMEAVIMPMSMSDADMATSFLFTRFRDPEKGVKINGEDNYFVEKLLPMMSGRKLTEAEKQAYEAPFQTVESRKPVWQWPMEIPFDGTPADNAATLSANLDWMKSTDTPLLLLTAEPGIIWTKKTLPLLKAELPDLQTVSVGSGLHYIQEVQPTEIGKVLNAWSTSLPDR